MACRRLLLLSLGILLIAGSLCAQTTTDVQTLAKGIYVPRGVWSAADSSKLILQDTTLALSGKRILVGSLHDPAFNCVNATPVGDHFDCSGSFEKFRELEKSTSYHNAARGDSGNVFPAEFALIVGASATDSVTIIDRTTGKIWASLTQGTDNWLYGTGSANDVVFCDGVIGMATSSNGMQFADLLMDRAWFYQTNGLYLNQATFQQRNAALGAAYIVSATPAIVNDGVNSASVIRDPGGKRDGLGRLAQKWGAATAGGGSIFDAYLNGIYDSSDTNTWLWGILLSGGSWLAATSDATRDDVQWYYSGFSKTADAFAANEGWDNNSTGSEDLAWGNAAIFSRLATIERASWAGTEAPLIIVGSDSGLVALHAKANDNTNGGQQLVEFGFNSGYMKGATTMACPMESSVGSSLADVSPYVNYLSTGGGTHNYVAGVIGKADSLTANAAWRNAHDDGDFDFGTSNWAVVVWMKSHSASNPGSSQNLFDLYQNPDRIYCNLETNGSLYALITDDNESTSDVVDPSTDIYDANWHFIVFQRDGATIYLYVDGELAGSAAVSAAAASLDPSTFYLGGYTAASAFISATVDQPQVIKGAALTATEIRDMYQQGLSAMQNVAASFPNDALTSVDVDYVRALPTGMFVAGDEDTATVFNRYGIPVQKYASPGGNIQDAALLAYGQDSVGVALVTTTKTQLIQPDVRAIDLAQYKHPFVQPAISQRVVVDSTGLNGWFWTIDDATDAAFTMGRREVHVLKGTYPGFTADQYGLFYSGESDSSTIIDGANASIGISVTQDFNYFHNLAAKTTVGGSGGFDAISVANTAVETTFDHIRVLGADDDCMNIDAPRTKIVNSDLRLCDDEGIDLQDESDHSIITHTIIKDQGGDPIVVFANGESSIITSNQLEKYIIDGETSTTKANNSEVSSW